MKVLNVRLHNIMRVSDIEFKLDEHSLYLVGGTNDQGKSSGLRGLLAALCGKKGMDNYPEVLLKNGEKEGWVKIDLSGDEELHDTQGFHVELLLKRKPSGTVMEKIRVTDSTGDPSDGPRSLLQSLFNYKALDPLEFERMEEKEQAKVLRDLTGLDFTDLDRERQQCYDDRRDCNRRGKELKARLESLAYHSDIPKNGANTSELLEELTRRQDHNQKIRRAKENIASSNQKLDAVKKEIKEMERRLAALNDVRGKLQKSIDQAKKQVDKAEPMDVDEIRAQLSRADEMTKKRAENEEYERVHKEHEKEQERWKTLDNRIARLDEQKAEKIAEAQLPVEGLEYDTESVYLDGLPFSQASASRRCVASTKIGMAMNPKLRLLVCEDGGRLDLDTLKVLEKVVKENNFQMIVEIVTRTDRDADLCQVIIEGGKLKKPPEK